MGAYLLNLRMASVIFDIYMGRKASVAKAAEKLPKLHTQAAEVSYDLFYASSVEHVTDVAPRVARQWNKDMFRFLMSTSTSSTPVGSSRTESKDVGPGARSAVAKGQCLLLLPFFFCFPIGLHVGKFLISSHRSLRRSGWACAIILFPRSQLCSAGQRRSSREKRPQGITGLPGRPLALGVFSGKAGL